MNGIRAFGTEPTMTSLEIAELVEKRHDNVRRTVETLGAQGIVTLPQIEEVSNPGPGPKTVMAYRIGKRDTYVIVAQLSPEFTARLVDRWQELEARQAPAFGLPRTMAEALRLAADQQEQLEQQQALISEQAPKAAFHDDVTEAINCQSVEECAKVLGTGRTRLFRFLKDQRFLMESNAPYQQYVDSGHFRVVEKCRQDRHGEKFTYTQTLVTGKGLSLIQRRLREAVAMGKAA